MSDKKRFWLGVLAGVAGSIIISSIINSIKTAFAVIIMIAVMLVSFDGSVQNPVYNDDYYDDDYYYGIEESSGADETQSKADEIKELLEKYYLFEYDELDLEEAELDGLMEGLNDPYSYYYSYDDIVYLNDSSSESGYSGVGMQVIQSQTTGDIVVYKVFVDSPAKNAGIEVGDILISVNGENIEGKSLDDVVALVKGEAGTKVSLGVRRGTEELEFTMNRSSINTYDVTYKKLDDEIGYIQFCEFTEEAVDEMKSAITSANADAVKGLVIDLRNNPGGTLDSAIQISDMFLKQGEIILTTADKNNLVTSYSSENSPIFTGYVVLLVNGNSASAAELFSAALHDHGVATLVGTQTYGKGVVQTLHTLSDGTYIKITSEYYYTPNGVCVNGVGITPDVVVEEQEGDTDVQLDAAVSTMKELFTQSSK